MMPEAVLFLLSFSNDCLFSLTGYFRIINLDIGVIFFLLETLIYYWLFARWTRTTHNLKLWGTLTLVHLAHWFSLISIDYIKYFRQYYEWQAVHNLGMIVLVNVMIFWLVRLKDFKGSKDYRIWMMFATLYYSATVSIIAVLPHYKFWFKTLGVKEDYNTFILYAVLLITNVIYSYAFYLGAKYTFADQLSTGKPPKASQPTVPNESAPIGS